MTCHHCQPLFKEEFKSKWVVSKTCNRFSSILIDKIHEQENTKVKGKGGVIGLTENPTALRRYMICGPELARCISEFESPAWSDENNTQLLPHHEEGLASQLSFKKQVQSFIDRVTGFGNPFEDDCSELLILNTRACADDSVIETVRSVETLGKAQYQQYKRKSSQREQNQSMIR